MAASCLPDPYDFDHVIDEKAWKKAMGMFTSKTGVSEKIRDVIDGYKKIDHTKLESQTCLKKCVSEAQFAAAKDAAKQYLDKSLHHVMHPVDALKSHLEKKLVDFKKEKLCSQATIKHAELLLKGIKSYKTALENSFEELDRDFNKVTAQKLKNFKLAIDKLEEYAALWPDAHSTLRKALDKATDDEGKLGLYDVFRRHYVRGFATSLPLLVNDVNVGKHASTWVTLAQDKAQPNKALAIDSLLQKLNDTYYEALIKDMKLSGYKVK